MVNSPKGCFRPQGGRHIGKSHANLSIQRIKRAGFYIWPSNHETYRTRGLGVMTSPLQGEGRRFNSGRVHHLLIYHHYSTARFSDHFICDLFWTIFPSGYSCLTRKVYPCWIESRYSQTSIDDGHSFLHRRNGRSESDTSMSFILGRVL